MGCIALAFAGFQLNASDISPRAIERAMAEDRQRGLDIVEENLSTGAVATKAMRSRYYAIGIPKLLALMEEAGFRETARLDGAFYQPALAGTKPG